MNKLYRFAAAAAAMALAASTASCSSPKAITFGNGTKTAMTIDGYDVPAGVFIYNELYAYNNASYTLYAKNGEYPTVEDVKKANIESMDATDWIQNSAVDYCKDFVATEKEFEKIGGELSAEDLQEIKDGVEQQLANTLFTDNGIGEESIRAILTNSYKQNAVFEHYYGIDAEDGCSEEELKEYFIDRTARIKYFPVSLVNEEGEAVSDDEKRELTKLVDGYIKEINSAKTNEKKLEKFDEVKAKYDEYTAKKAEEAAAAKAEENGEEATTTTTTTTTSADDEVTTTTTTDPFANEVTLTKLTTTTADESADDAETTTTTAADDSADDSQKALKAYNDYVFNDLKEYTAEKYQYDENTIYVIIKGDIKERMTDDDMWSEDSVEALISERYYSDFTDRMKKIAEGMTPEKNASAFRRFSPFKLKLENA
ncbi:MAG TPA: hypothetical protein PLH98_05195 [Ruminococcus flavefaciens]|nr:hypothetical protein [Ruminococcus flavefaciens]HQL99939.1 hypothetical protein [Ruminococcus flavefaciens]